MEHLVIVETDIIDPSWVEDSVKEVTPLVHARGGRYMTRSSGAELLEGDHKPQYSLVARFPTKEAALAFYHSREYAPFKAARQNGSKSRIVLVPVENAAA